MATFRITTLVTVQIEAASEADAVRKYHDMDAKQLFYDCLVSDEIDDIEDVS